MLGLEVVVEIFRMVQGLNRIKVHFHVQKFELKRGGLHLLFLSNDSSILTIHNQGKLRK